MANKFIDTSGNEYTAIKEIYSGGQGKVYALKGDKLAAKIFHNESPAIRELLPQRLKFIKKLDLSDLDIAKPLQILEKPDFGYIMELMTGMVPIKTLMYLPTDEASAIQWYLKTGGLQHRLRLLARTATILAQLHSKGLVYANPSPDNIFISEDWVADEVCLIDMDNLQYRSSVASSIYYTPGFGAPELVQRRSGVNTLTDVYAFAVIAFQNLTMVHPFMGDLVTIRKPQLEKQALEGRLAWIEHSEDNSNRSSLGIPREFVLSGEIKTLFRQTFEAGLNQPTARPSMAAWAETLLRAADATLICPKCGYSYYYIESACPLCKCKRPPFVLARIALWVPAVEAEKSKLQNEYPNLNTKKVRNIDFFIIEQNTTKLLDTRLMRGNPIAHSDMPSFEIEFSKKCLKLRNLGKTDYWLQRESKKPLFLKKRAKSLPLEELSTWLLHLGKEDKLHRIVNFKLNN